MHIYIYVCVYNIEKKIRQALAVFQVDALVHVCTWQHQICKPFFLPDSSVLKRVSPLYSGNFGNGLNIFGRSVGRSVMRHFGRCFRKKAWSTKSWGLTEANFRQSFGIEQRKYVNMICNMYVFRTLDLYFCREGRTFKNFWGTTFPLCRVMDCKLLDPWDSE